MTVRCFINEVIDFHANLTALFVTQEENLFFLLHRRELTMLRWIAVRILELVFPYLAIRSHINLGNGYRDNLILSFLIKVNK